MKPHELRFDETYMNEKFKFKHFAKAKIIAKREMDNQNCKLSTRMSLILEARVSVSPTKLVLVLSLGRCHRRSSRSRSLSRSMSSAKLSLSVGVLCSLLFSLSVDVVGEALSLGRCLGRRQCRLPPSACRCPGWLSSLCLRLCADSRFYSAAFVLKPRARRAVSDF